MFQIEIDIKTWGQNQEQGQVLYARVVWQRHEGEHHLDFLYQAILEPPPFAQLGAISDIC